MENHAGVRLEDTPDLRTVPDVGENRYHSPKAALVHELALDLDERVFSVLDEEE